MHEIAREVHEDARVVYVDYDPVVQLHAEVLLGSAGDVVSLQADLRDPAGILNAPEVTSLIDFDRPVGVMMIAVLHFVMDGENPKGIIAAFRERMAPGSYLALSHSMAESSPEAIAQLRMATAGSPAQSVFRGRDEVLSLFEGFDLIGPGLVPVQDWRVDEDPPAVPLLAEPPKLRVEGGLAHLASP
ncbi:hypothetical protein Ssi02_75590 [Sinosporangium siamense]|uniref:S-adenosyl methyltransferase n=1 Tax=Sinosporangium siamense TaxID=1367973 RepID=A0A919RPG2_9ACTN|nr:hypothetical protein Ssi02_75590 [Sinosporangium siamense]